MILNSRRLALIAGILVFLASCDPAPMVRPVAGGGIGGTGKGTVTDYSSIVLNDIRRFEISPTTLIFLDGEPVSEADLRAAGTGLVAWVAIAKDVSADFTSGTALGIAVERLVKGPVTATTPDLRALGQTVSVTGATVLDDLGSVADLAVGDVVEVSGYADADNTIQATRLEYKGGGTPVWKLTGPVKSLIPETSLVIGAQTVFFAGITPQDCETGLGVGDLVEIKAAADPAFEAGDPLATVQSLKCVSPGLGIPEDSEGDLLVAQLEGLVDGVALPYFTLSGQQVLTSEDTTYKKGDPQDIVEGAKLEVEGVLDTASGILTANRIRFREMRVKIIAPVASEDIAVGESLDILGITVFTTPLTRDKQGVVSGGTADAQIKVEGYVDTDGRVLATAIRKEGEMDFNNVNLEGPVLGIQEPPLFSLLGVHVDTSDTSRLTGKDGRSLTEAQFFSALSLGDRVKVERARYDGENTISSAWRIRIDD